MTGILPLIAMWLFANRSGGGSSAAAPAAARKAKARKKNKAPRWPTPASPPPMPAFQAARKPAPSADPSQTSTPLADLHNNPPTLAPISAPEKAKQAAISAFKKRSTSLLQQRLRASMPGASTQAAATVPVASIQKILTTRGYQVVPDGLYGPKTASAWAMLARSKQLSPTIARVGPKIAKVVARTYDTLSVPAIP